MHACTKGHAWVRTFVFDRRCVFAHVCVCGRVGPRGPGRGEMGHTRTTTYARTRPSNKHKCAQTSTQDSAHGQPHHTNTRAHKHAKICARGHTHRFTHKHAHHRNQQVRTHPSACTYTHASAGTYTHASASAHKRTRMRTRTRTHRERSMHIAESNKCAHRTHAHARAHAPHTHTSHKICLPHSPQTQAAAHVIGGVCSHAPHASMHMAR